MGINMLGPTRSQPAPPAFTNERRKNSRRMHVNCPAIAGQTLSPRPFILAARTKPAFSTGTAARSSFHASNQNYQALPHVCERNADRLVRTRDAGHGLKRHIQ